MRRAYNVLTRDRSTDKDNLGLQAVRAQYEVRPKSSLHNIRVGLIRFWALSVLSIFVLLKFIYNRNIQLYARCYKSPSVSKMPESL